MASKFTSLGLIKPLINTLTQLGITIPTAIQEKVIPVLLENKNDIVAQSKTGSGKTAAFGLPLLQLVDTNIPTLQGVILVPTRELGNQIFTNLVSFATNIPNIKIVSVYGGVPIKPQIQQLAEGAHLVIATPGRLIDLLQRNAIQLKNTQFLVLDEADEMVTALKEGLDEIIAALPKERRTWLFSATIPGSIKQLVQNYLHKNVTHLSAESESAINQNITHQYSVVEPIEKLEFLMHFLNQREGERGIIFCKTKAAVNKLAKNLAINKFSSGALHGSLTQAIRERIMNQFRAGQVSILVATDLAARGIDVAEIAYVVNYHLPDTYETYVHRSGRTARAQAKGISLTILQPEEVAGLEDFRKNLGIDFIKFEKPTPESIEENNTVLWAKKIFKTKPNHEISAAFKGKIKEIFHHLSKDELIEKVLAFQLAQTKKEDASIGKK
ncbi:DEAD/DEAH box helicase [Flavobacterium psychrotolerans]|uniref:DEAD/DEAH box helicase n=1 Tax=Flavobacterium psychrotolerans TaxID=2169410 RepID=A0A2U1JK96_9FLAO|nr:DEAD/DEAH box helicase [Flavobacterium psychrotolerans]PWA05570.1 DEAD/DEAH box helicase [Flavobacterium psychrotolerans]